MCFYTDIFDGVTKMRAVTFLGDIFCLHERTNNPLKYVHTSSKYGNIVTITASDTKESFSRAVIDKGWVYYIIVNSSGGKEENKVAMAQYL